MDNDDKSQVSLPPARCDRMLYIRLQQASARRRVSMSRIIRDALEEHLREEDEAYQEAMSGGVE